MIGPLFARALPAGEKTEVETGSDVQLVNIALATHKEGRTTIKLHYTSYEFDEESSSDEDEEEEDSSGEMEAELNPKVNGDTSKGEDVTVVVASLIPEKVEFATINVFLPAAEVFEFIVEGPNDVHIMGNEVFQDADMLSHDDYPYDSYDSDLYDSEVDSELAEDEGGLYDPETGLPIEYDSDDLLDGESDEEDLEDDSDRFAELKEDLLPVANGHDADLPSNDDDDEMDADEKNNEVDMSKLSKSQRKKLAKKLKAEAAGKAEVKAVVGKKEEKVTISKNGKKTDEVKTTAQVTVNGANGKDVKATAKKASKKTTLPNGTVIEDMKIGDGAAAKPGQKVSLRYIGKLQDGKVFDSNTKGKPFSFKLGKNEVIKGWDTGIEGMRPGGERRLTIPPSAAYGKAGTDGIPPNSVLKFEVKLLTVSN